MQVIRFVVGILLAVAAPAARADIFQDWIRVAESGADGRIVTPPLQGEKERTAPLLVALAMFEAVNAIDRRYQSVLDVPAAGAKGSEEAAAITAAHDVLVGIHPERRAQFDQTAALAMSGIGAGAARDAGVRAGEAAAAAALTRKLFDGPVYASYRPIGEPGQYAPPVPVAFRGWSLRSRLLVLKSPGEAMPPPPPPMTGERYARDFNEVKLLGGIGQPKATPATLAHADFLAAFRLEPTVARVAARLPRGVDRARLWAMLMIGRHDVNALIGLSKMQYMTWRPYNAIRNADRDGNPLTERDPDWEPVMPTPVHPEYPCGHCTMSGFLAALLAPETDGPIEVASETARLPVSVVFSDWPAFLEATSLARIEGGMHFRFSNEAGQAMGRKIGELTRARFAPPLRR